MRGHKYLLGDPLIQSIFQKWLQKHRLSLILRKENKVIVKVSFNNRIAICKIKY